MEMREMGKVEGQDMRQRHIHAKSLHTKTPRIETWSPAVKGCELARKRVCWGDGKMECAREKRVRWCR